MPYKFETDKVRLPKGTDKRVKLTDIQRQDIRKLGAEGLSQRKLAKRFAVSRRLIQFILDPSKLVANLQKRKESGGSKQYYDKNKHRETMKAHRQYKQEVLQKTNLNPRLS